MTGNKFLLSPNSLRNLALTLLILSPFALLCILLLQRSIEVNRRARESERVFTLQVISPEDLFSEIESEATEITPRINRRAAAAFRSYCVGEQVEEVTSAEDDYPPLSEILSKYHTLTNLVGLGIWVENKDQGISVAIMSMHLIRFSLKNDREFCVAIYSYKQPALHQFSRSDLNSSSSSIHKWVPTMIDCWALEEDPSSDVISRCITVVLNEHLYDKNSTPSKSKDNEIQKAWVSKFYSRRWTEVTKSSVPSKLSEQLPNHLLVFPSKRGGVGLTNAVKGKVLLEHQMNN